MGERLVDFEGQDWTKLMGERLADFEGQDLTEFVGDRLADFKGGIDTVWGDVVTE